MQGKNLRTPKQIADERPVLSYAELRSALNRRDSNGLKAAVVQKQVGAKIFIDIVAYDRWLIGRQPTEPLPNEKEQELLITRRALEIAAGDCLARSAQLPNPPRETSAILVAKWVSRAAI